VGADGQGGGAPYRRGQVVRRTLARGAAIGAALLALYILSTLPRRTVHLPAVAAPSVLTGAFHVHTTRSDGSGDVEAIAAAAADAGLQFVILTDHGDATRAPDPPAYRHGVLVIDAVEVSTLRGHVIALGLTQPSPFPLAGEPTDVIDDIHRLHGRAIAAHPDSPKPALRWIDNTAPYDGLEILNADSEWRDEGAPRLLATGLRALWRPTEAIVSLFARPAGSLLRWDQGLRSRPIVGIAGVDAHARIGADDNGGSWGWAALHLPTYRQMFRALGQVVLLDAPPSGDAAQDAAAVVSALVRGRSYAAVRGIANPARITFTAEQDGRVASLGDAIVPGVATTFRIDVPHAPGSQVLLIADGELLARGWGGLQMQRTATARSYRVEAYVPGFRVPWIITNPIVSGTPPVTTAPPPSSVTEWDTLDLAGAHVEHDAASKATLTPRGSAVELAFELGPGAPAGQFAALAVPIAPDPRLDRLRVTARASQPMRVSVQLRATGNGPRWRRSMYLTGSDQTIEIPVGEFRGVAHEAPLPQALATIDALLLVVDTLNTRAGTRGSVSISGLAASRN
jgi:hypothetical protein